MLTHYQKLFNEFLWETKLTKLNKAQVLLIQNLRIFYGAFQDLKSGLPSLRAMGLVYTTLLSLVPLLAVSFSVLKGFGAHNQLEPMLTSLLEPLGEKGIQISQQIISFVDNIKVGVLGSVGLLLLIYTVLSLVKKIENAFNTTWRISVTRNIVQRFSNYLSVILIGPLLLFASAGLSASLHSSAIISSLQSIEPFGTLIVFLGLLTPYILTVISFSLIYLLIPNTKVQFRSALYGAIITTILWKAAGTLFTAFIVDSTNYAAVYSSFAILIIFMIWIYVSWLIILTGASISYYHQNPDRISNKSKMIRLSCRLREKLALTIMQLIANNFHNNKKQWTLKTLASETTISEDALMIIIPSLISDRLVTTSGEDNAYYLPAQSIENISVAAILNSARRAEETRELNPDDVESESQVCQIIIEIEQAVTSTIENKTLKDLI